jgi:hypothetical protein
MLWLVWEPLGKTGGFFVYLICKNKFMGKEIKIEFLLIKDENSHCNSISTLKSLFATDSHIVFQDKQTIKVEEFTAEFHITTDVIKNKNTERYFSISLVKITDDKNESKNILDLTSIFHKIKAIVIPSKHFKLIEIWNDASFYYSKLSYPLIYEVENMMRMLIYNFMLTKLGKEWYKIGFPSILNNKIKKDKSDKEDSPFQDDLLHKIDFIHIELFLFTSYTPDSDKIYDKIKAAVKLNDLKLTELKELVPNDNWTRYFEQIIKFKDFKKNWARLYELRCRIAHNNLITKEDFEEINKISTILKEKIVKGNSLISKIKINEEEKVELSQSAVNAFYEPLLPDYNRLHTTGSLQLNNSLFTANPILTSSPTSYFGTSHYQIGTSPNSIFAFTPPKKCLICGNDYNLNGPGISSLNICSECFLTNRGLVITTKK